MRYCPDCKNVRARALEQERQAKRRKDYPPVPCSHCGEMTERFHETDKFCSSRCKEKQYNEQMTTEQRREKYAKHRSWSFDQKRDYMLRYTYGINQEVYEKLLAEQGGGCAICGKTPEEEKRNLAVDHDHVTGEIFGILCATCNKILIGRIRSPEMFARAANYLSKGTGLIVPYRIKKGPKRRRRKHD